MTNEKKPKKRMLLPEGWRSGKVESCSKEEVSKKGNPQYIIGILDIQTWYVTDIYAINVPGKRWILKSICEACNVPVNSEGKFLFEPPEPPPIAGKDIMFFVEHEDNTWIDREGQERKDKQHKITDFKAIEWKD